MVALAACQKEVQETVQPPVLDEGLDGELVEVTFAVDVTDAEQTKTISDGLSATNLQYAVYRAEDYVANDGTKYNKGQYIPSLSQGDDPKASFSNAKIEKQGDRTWLVTLTLAKNVKYDIVFWACVYKCICHITSAPEDLVCKAKDWLYAHGMSDQIFF